MVRRTDKRTMNMGVGCSLLALGVACGRDVVVGASDGEPDGEVDLWSQGSESEEDQSSRGGLGGACGDRKYLLETITQEQPVTDNRWEELAGRVFAGEFSGGEGSLRFEVSDNLEARLVSGTPAPLTGPDESFLCTLDESNRCPLEHPLKGAVYEVIDGRLEEGKLQFALLSYSPFADWCAQQEPLLVDTSDGKCEYWVRPEGPSEVGEEGCSFQGEVVDCGWLDLTRPWQGVCLCDSTRCFFSPFMMGVDHPQSLWVDARLSEDGRVIAGDFVHGRKLLRFELMLLEPEDLP